MLTKVEDQFTETPLELAHFQHVHKRLKNAQPYKPMVHEKWNNFYPLTSESWSSFFFFKKLGTPRIVMPLFVECYFHLQVGLLHSCFYSYCPLCSNLKDEIPGGIKHALFECPAVDRIWTLVTGWNSSKRSPLMLLAGANLKAEELMKINRFLFFLVKLNGLKFSKIEYHNPDDPLLVVLQNRDIALMLKRISNDSGFWLNR
ncbi:unnamed protein product [Ambrosiozyma monospora]|uniref:Unnamed protein product n=1 Tax=Ambrosiozyma monospora TaxID=43982 RepID=A0A9W7DI82_AMBMO|nr:unnamed protein product [Ambrosiozyma monospora]